MAGSTKTYMKDLWKRVEHGAFAAGVDKDSVTQSMDASMRAQDARSFINNIYYGGFSGVAGDDAIVQAARERNLEALPLELKLDLYEAIANDAGPGEGNVHYLDALNKEMDLTKDFYLDQTKEAEQFFGETNRFNLENNWAQLGSGISFSEALHQQIHSGSGLESPSAQILAKFIIKEYAKFTGNKCPEINFVNEAPNSCGATGTKSDGTEFINLNVNAEAFKGNFLAAVDTQLHEFKHIQQKQLAEKYLAGEIKEGDPNYITARVFAANLKTKSGYITPPPFHDRMTKEEVERYKQGFKAYEDQPAEIDARTFGQAAAHAAYETYGKNPPKHGFNADYDNMPIDGMAMIFAGENGVMLVIFGGHGNDVMNDFDLFPQDLWLERA